MARKLDTTLGYWPAAVFWSSPVKGNLVRAAVWSIGCGRDGGLVFQCD